MIITKKDVEYASRMYYTDKTYINIEKSMYLAVC
jgi:hypothetical protein